MIAKDPAVARAIRATAFTPMPLTGRSVLPLHRARHTFATDLRRVADLGAASQTLGHSDLSTTASIYGHYDLSDPERAMEALAKARRADDEEPAE
jgi:integrase